MIMKDESGERGSGHGRFKCIISTCLDVLKKIMGTVILLV